VPPLYKGENLSWCARSAGGIHTPLHTRYVRVPHHADGRNPIRGFTGLAPHRCRATPDWRGFLTAIGSRSFPIGRPFDQTPPVGRTGLDTRPSRQRWGDYWLSKGRRSASLLVRRRISPPCEDGNHARTSASLIEVLWALYVVLERQWRHALNRTRGEDFSYHLCEPQSDGHAIGKDARIVI
jgi:hypothetical protein